MISWLGRLPEKCALQLWARRINVNRKISSVKTHNDGPWLYWILWLFLKENVEHRVTGPINGTETRCEPYRKKLPNVSHNLKRSATHRKRNKENQTLRKSWAWNSTYPLAALVCLALIREPTPGSWANLLIISSAKITSFLARDSKRLLQISSKRRIANIFLIPNIDNSILKTKLYYR